MSFSTYSQCRIHYCYTGGFVSAGATYPCRATRKSGVCGQHLRIRRSVQFILAGAVRYNVPRICAALLCRALRRVNRLCSSTVSGTANMSRHGSTLCSPTVDKLLCRSLFSERSHVGNLRQTLQRKRGDSQEGGKPQVVYPLVRPRGVSARPRSAGLKKSCSQYSR